MNKSQYAALKDFCIENGCTTREVLKALKSNGTVDSTTKIKELGSYVSGDSYEAMQRFLEENLA